MRAVLAPPKSTKIVFGRGSAPDTAGVAHDAPPYCLIGWEGIPLPIPHPTLPFSRFRRSILAPSASRFQLPSSLSDFPWTLGC